MSGELKFNVKIVSDLITADSPEGVWTVNIHSCQVKENDWITTTVSTKNYNVLDLEQSSLIATVPYEGPSLEFCDTVGFTVTDANGTNY